MNTPDDGNTSLLLPFQYKRRRSRLLIATALAMLGAGAIHLGVGSPFASAAPQSAPPSSATATIQDSQQWHAADADADVGPGQCEPCVLVVP
jgi:hypothetical protein